MSTPTTTATALAMAANEARKRERDELAEQEKQRVALVVAQGIKRLESFWQTLGIDPAKYTVNGNQITWTGSVTIGDRPALTMPVKVKYERGNYYIAVGDHSDFLQEGSNALGEILLDAWYKAARTWEQERQMKFNDRYRKLLSDNSVRWNLDDEERTINDLTWEDMPDPFDENIAKLREALAGARQHKAEYLAERQLHMDAIARIRPIAARYIAAMQAWDSTCQTLAAELTRTYWQPFTVYAIDYVPVGTPVFNSDYDDDSCTPSRTIYTLTNPAEMAFDRPGTTIKAINGDGSESYNVTIGAFFEGRVEREFTQPPGTDKHYRFYHMRRIGNSDTRVNFPPTMTAAEVDKVMAAVTIPAQPQSFVDTVRAELGILITNKYSGYDPSFWLGDFSIHTISSEWLDLNPAPDSEPDDDEPAF